jgi:O-antigen ligase
VLGAPRRIQDWLLHPVVLLVVATILGLVVGLQFVKVQPRIVKLALAAVVLFVVVRYPTYVAVGLFLILYPFPTAIFIGNTNFIFALLITSVWLVKVGLGKEPWFRSSLLGGGIFLLLLIHLLALAALDPESDSGKAISGLQYLVASVLLYALMVNSVTTTRRLHTIFQFMTFGSLIIYVNALLEFALPAVRLIPEWYLISPAMGRVAEAGGRAGGVYRFHALLADSAAMNVFLQLFLMSRARKTWRKLYHLVVAVLAIVMIFITVNRGGFIILILGFLVAGWKLRRDLRVSYLTVGLASLVIVSVLAERFTRGYFENVTLFFRLATTRVENFMPENRTKVWEYYAEEIVRKPVLGHGPYIDEKRIGFWPHNAYMFYAYTTGLLGLLVFLWILGKALWKTRVRGAVSWLRGTYARGALLVVHIMLVQFAVGQMRTDHQRGNVAIYHAYALLGLAASAWRISRREGELTE